MSEKITASLGAHQIFIETGKLAKQADGSVTVQLGETIVLVAAVAATNAKPGQEFFPLTVDYREKAAAAGKFPGGYFKREGRPTEKEILTSRLTDRPIRPLFPKGWFNEVQVQSILLSADGENDSDVLSIIGASAALSVSDIPWAGPLGALRIGRINGEFVANPTHSQMAESDMDIIFVGNADDVVMFEGSSKEISEADFVAALKFGHECCQPLIQAQKDLVAKVGKPKRKITQTVVPEEILKEAKALAGERIIPALLTHAKLEREAAVKAVTDEVSVKLVEKFGAEKVTDSVLKEAFYYIQKETVRGLLMNETKRLDGRGLDDIRPISAEVGFLPRAHGSSLFTRGETQAVSLVTLGTTEDAQEFDAYTGGETQKKFMLHYNFPNYSVGETGRISGPGRREIGHGALAERSIEPVLPLDTYPYAVRVTSEIMESNGSSSMASVCAGSLALMDAGVPLQRPVAGISIGICTTHDDADKITQYKLLTDIIGWEDAFCDMDCKIAGTEKGITGFQLDLKLRGLPLPIMTEALEKARIGRLFVIGEMAKVLPAPRAELSKYAPRIVQIKINPEKIGALIGPGGKNIKRIVEESGCEINIDDDGTVNVYSLSEEGMKIARGAIEGMTAEAEIGKIYRGKVVTIKEFGAFVEFLPGKDGLVHISELANFRVKQTEDIVKMGDEIWVKCLGVDEKGRVRLSRKAAMEDRDREMSGNPDAPREATDSPDMDDPDADRPENDRPENDRPEGDRPEGARYAGGRSEGGRFEAARPEGGRPEGGRFEGGRPESSRPEGSRFEGGRSEGSRPEGSRFEGSRPEGSRPEGSRFEGSRPEGSRPEGGRSEGGRHDSGRRPDSGHRRSSGGGSGGGSAPRRDRR